MTDRPLDEKQARFEAMLSQVLTTDEVARGHRAAKALRGQARQWAVGARAAFERNRDRQPKQRGPQP
jgi:hypothetical protein